MNDDKDAECNRLFRKLEELKAKGEGGTCPSAEYLQALYALRDLARGRVAAVMAGA